MTSPDLRDFLDNEVVPRLDVDKAYSHLKVRWKSRGRDKWRGDCPFHNGADSGSFVVFTDTLASICPTGCGDKWRPVTSVAFQDGRIPTGEDWLAAVRFLAGLAAVPFPEHELSPEEEKRYAYRERREALLETVLSIVQEALQKAETEGAKKTKAYLEGRGYVVDGDRPRYGHYESPKALETELERRGYTKKELLDAGLSLHSLGLDSQDWSGRLVIPWRDRRGRLRTLAARSLEAKPKEKKYLYPLGEVVGSLPPYGLDRAFALGRPDHLVLVEGFFDADALLDAGLQAVSLGGPGSRITREYLEGLGRLGVHRVTLLLDRDETGLEGTLSALDKSTKGANAVNAPLMYAVDPRLLSPYKDADELLRKEGDKGRERVKDLIRGAVSGEVYRAAAFLEGLTPEAPEGERREALERLAGYVGTLPAARSGLVLDELLRITAERTGWSRSSLEAYLQDVREGLQRKEAQDRVERAFRDGKSLPEVARVLRDYEVEGGAAPSLPFSVDRLLEAAEQAQEGRLSWWSPLDKAGVLFRPGELALIAARTGHGKTSFLVNLLHTWLQAPLDPEELLLFYSYEEPEVRIGEKLLSVLVRLDSSAPMKDRPDRAQVEKELRYFHEGGVQKNFRPAMEAALTKLRSWEDRFVFVYRPSITADELAQDAETFAKGRNVGAVFVDYLQHVPPPVGRRTDRRDMEVSAIGRTLKELAVRLDVPVVAGAQLNRETASGTGRDLPAGSYYDAEVQRAIRRRRPELHHLREGGSEQEADLVLGLLSYGADYREDELEAGPAPATTRLEVGVLKNRYGTPGSWASLAFEGARGVIREADKGEQL
jgi:replicative DNA helicase